MPLDLTFYMFGSCFKTLAVILVSVFLYRKMFNLCAEGVIGRVVFTIRFRNFNVLVYANIMELLSFWILTSNQPHRVTSGRITHAIFFYTSSDHMFV